MSPNPWISLPSNCKHFMMITTIYHCGRESNYISVSDTTINCYSILKETFFIKRDYTTDSGSDTLFMPAEDTLVCGTNIAGIK